MKVFLDTIGCRLNQSEIERMAIQFRAAGHGNIALTGEIVPQGEEPFTVAIALGKSCIATITMAMGRRMTAAPSMEPASAVRGRF